MGLNLRPKRVDIVITRKDSVLFEYVVLDDVTGDPINFTGTTVVMTVNPRIDGSETDLFTVSPFNTLDATGVLQFKPTTVNNDKDPGRYWYDIEWTSGSSVQTIIYGAYMVVPSISN